VIVHEAIWLAVIVFAAISFAVMLFAATLSAVIKLFCTFVPNTWNIAFLAVWFCATHTSSFHVQTEFADVVVFCNTVVLTATSRYIYVTADIVPVFHALILYTVPSGSSIVPDHRLT
jgi:hypothetical protein